MLEPTGGRIGTSQKPTQFTESKMSTFPAQGPRTHSGPKPRPLGQPGHRLSSHLHSNPVSLGPKASASCPAAQVTSQSRLGTSGRREEAHPPPPHRAGAVFWWCWRGWSEGTDLAHPEGRGTERWSQGTWRSAPTHPQPRGSRLRQLLQQKPAQTLPSPWGNDYGLQEDWPAC